MSSTLNLGQFRRTRRYLLDGHGQPVPLGAIGDLYVGGAARSQLGRPELTAERFLRDPFSSDPEARMYRTGERARYLPDGSLVMLARDDHSARLGGDELAKVEACLREHPSVREAAVLARSHAGEQSLLAYVVAAAAGSTELEGDLRRHLSEQLPPHLQPTAYVQLDVLPRTAGGKLNRKALPALVARPAYQPPQGEIESTIASIWQEMLGVEAIGRHDHFFDLGGHSLLAVQFVGRLIKHGLRVTVQELFQHPQLDELAAHILAEQPQPAEKAAPVPAQPRSFHPLVTLHNSASQQLPLFCIPGAGSTVTDFVSLVQALDTPRPVYGLEPRGLDSAWMPHVSVEEAALCNLAEIDGLRLTRPIHLLGHSHGGRVAFEMARLLASQGRPVASLTLVDTEAPGKVRTLRERQILLSYLRSFEFTLGKSLSVDQGIINAEQRSAFLQALHAALLKAKMLPKQSRPDVLNGPLATFAAACRTSYIPAAPYPGRTLLVQVRDPALDKSEDLRQREVHAETWRHWAPQLEIWHGPGHHFSVLREPHVQQLAQRWSQMSSASSMISA